MRRRYPLVIILAMALGLLLTMQGADAKLMGREVKLGFINPFTGWATPLGKDNEIAMEVAVQEINSSGGIGGVPIKLFKYNTNSKPEEAINLMRRLANRDKVLAVMGPFISSLCEVTFPVANRIGIVAVSSASAAPDIAAKNRPWTFRNVMTSERILEPAFKVWVAKNNIKRAAMQYDTKDFLSKTEGTKVFPGLFKRYGVAMVEKQTHQTGNLDFSAQALAIKRSNPQGVVMAALHYESSNLARELRRIGVKVPLFIGVGSTSPTYIRLGKSNVVGTMSAIAFWPTNPAPRVVSFVTRYKEVSKGKTAPHYSANLYDNLFIIKDAIEKNGVTNDPKKLKEDRAKIRDWWTNLKGYVGVAGLTNMTKTGDTDKKVYVMEVRNGKWLPLN